MKAIICTKYGDPLDVLQMQEVEKPTPAANRVLVKVHATSVNPVDLAPVKGAFLARLLGTGLLKPKQKITGTDIAGRVEAVGKDVKLFKPGDEVFGASPAGFAEYTCAREDLLVLKPAQVTFQEAAAVPVAALTALQGLRKGQIQHGQSVLIHSASGGVGTFAVQIARSFGAEVTAVCSTMNLDSARSMGAEHVIDYSREDFTKNGRKYDLIFAVNGYHSMPGYRNSLNPKGMCIVAGGSLAQISQALLLGPLISKAEGRKIGFMGIATLNQKDLFFLKELLETGKVKPAIDKNYPFSGTAEAVQYLMEGHARGKVVITVAS